jgi:hypothetical protein
MIRSMTALCKRCCRLSSKPTKTTTTMTHHPRLSASRPMGAMQQPRQPLFSTIRSMGVTPPRHRPLLSARRQMRAICRRKEMSRTLAPMATKWVPLAMAPRLPLAYLLCDNQLFFQFSDKELRELGSHRRRLPRYETRRAFLPELEGEWGRPHGWTVPRLLGMHRSQGTPLHPRAACRLRSLVPQRAPQPTQGGRCWANPRPLCLQQRPRTLKHDRAACRPWSLVWVRAPRPAK